MMHLLAATLFVFTTGPGQNLNPPTIEKYISENACEAVVEGVKARHAELPNYFVVAFCVHHDGL